MDLAEICRVMRGRWYVLLPGLLLTAAALAGVSFAVPVTYQSQSTVMLLNSEKATLAYDGNPFLSTQTSLTGMADSLARNLNSDASIADLKAKGVTDTYEAKIADNALGPLMWLTVTGTDKGRVLKSDRTLTAYAAQRLKQFQTEQSVAPKAMIRMTTVVPPQEPVAETKTRLQYLVMAGLAGFALSMVATFYVEARKRPHPPARETPPDTRGRSAGRPGPRPAGQPTAQPTALPDPPPAAEEPVERPVPQRAARGVPRWAAERPTGTETGTTNETGTEAGTESDTHRFV